MISETSRQATPGCVFEIKEPLNAVPLQRLGFVIDATTDQEFLRQTFEKSCRELRSDSPNLGASSSALQPFTPSSLGYDGVQNLLTRLCAAAGSAASPVCRIRHDKLFN